MLRPDWLFVTCKKMSSEVCPFCGKTYKRLKSHLPHCKAAASSKTPLTKHDVTANQTSSSQLAAALSEPTAKVVKSTKTDTKKGIKVSPAAPLQSAATSSSSQTLSTSGSLPPLTKKNKPKLSEQIKIATMPLISTQSPSPISNPKKKSLRALIEAAKSKQVSQGSLEGTRSTSEDLPSGLTPFVADPLSSRTTAQTEIKTNPDKNLVKDNAHPAFVPTDTKPKGAVKMKVPKTKKAAQSLSTTKDTSSPLESQVNNTSPRLIEDFLVGDREGIEDISLNKLFLTSGSGHQTRITLQDVKATLGRAKTRPSILSQIQTTDDQSSKIRPGTHLSPVSLPTGNQDVDSSLVKTKSLPRSSSQLTELQSVKRKSSKSKSLIPLRHDGSPQPELTPPATPLISGHLSSQVSQAQPLPHTASMNEGLKVGHHMTRLPQISPSLHQLSSPNLFLLAPQTLPARVETLRADDGVTMEKSQLGIMKQNTADDGTKGVLTQRSLGQVRLRELPEWLACKTPTHPRDVVEMVQRGWQWYYKKYIDVKKGGVGGLGMLLAGYCVLGYIWSYPHIKRDRWRKHH